MRPRYSLLVPFLLMFWPCALHAQDVHDKFWRSYVEWETQGGDIWAGQGNLFLPLHQTEVSLLFADFRGNWNNSQAAHGNFGLAYRHMLVNDWLFGVHGAYDTRHSPFNNKFHQGTIGIELLNPDWGLRGNGYLAGEGAQLLPDLNSVSLVGNNLMIRQASERAYSGMDFEIERRLWYHESPQDQRWKNWVSSQDLEIWGAIGVFHFDNDAAGFEDITGPRARLEMRLFDVPLAGPDSRVVLGGQYEHDDVRGSVSSGMLTLRIPFGRGTSAPRGLLRGLNRRMVAPIERNTNIVSVVGLEAAEGAAFTRTGQEISEVLTIDATTVNPETVVATAPIDSLVIVDGSAGNILPGSIINVQDGQVLMGGGSSLSVRGLTSGATATFNAPGTRPTVDSANNSTFAVDNNSSLVSMDIRNSGNGLSGILLNNNTNVLIDDIGIDVSGSNSVGIQSSGVSQFVVNRSRIGTSGQFGNGIVLLDNNDASVVNTSISTSGSDAEGILVADNSFLSLRNSRIFTSGASGSEGILATDSAQVLADNNVVTTLGPSTIGILASPGALADTMAISVRNSTINSTGHGVALGGAGFGAGTLDASVLGNTITTQTGANAIDVESNGVAVLNASAQGNALEPIVGTIRLNEIGGDIFVTQSAPGTTGNGIDAANGLPFTNVLIPGNAIDFDAPQPTGPMAP